MPLDSERNSSRDALRKLADQRHKIDAVAVRNRGRESAGERQKHKMAENGAESSQVKIQSQDRLKEVAADPLLSKQIIVLRFLQVHHN